MWIAGYLSDLGRQMWASYQAQVSRRELHIDDRCPFSGEGGEQVRPVESSASEPKSHKENTYVPMLSTFSSFSGGWSSEVPLTTVPFSRVFGGSPPAALTSQQRTVQSAPPLTRRLDSALKASEYTDAVWPNIFLMHLPDPKSHSLIARSSPAAEHEKI